MLTRHEPKLIKGSLDKNDAKAVYLAVEGAPPGTTPPGRLTPLPVALALQAEGFPRKEAAELESALRAAGKGARGEPVPGAARPRARRPGQGAGEGPPCVRGVRAARCAATTTAGFFFSVRCVVLFAWPYVMTG